MAIGNVNRSPNPRGSDLKLPPQWLFQDTSGIRINETLPDTANKGFYREYYPEIVVVSPEALPNHIIGTTYSYQLLFKGPGTLSASVTSGALPTGMSMTSGGLISGPCVGASTYSFGITITSTDPKVITYNMDFRITAVAIALPNPLDPLILFGYILPTGLVDTAYVGTLFFGGGTSPTISITGGSFPPGLSCDTSGNITGTCTLEGSYTFEYTVTDGILADAVGLLTIEVNASFSNTIFFLSENDLPTAGELDVYSHPIQVIGNTAPVLYSATGLPTGLSIGQYTGYISGVPSAGTAGSYTPVITAQNGVDTTGTKTFNLTVLP